METQNGVIVRGEFLSRDPNDLQDEFDIATTDALKAIGNNYYLKNGYPMPLEKVHQMKQREYESYKSLCKSIDFQPATFHDFVIGFPIFEKETTKKITEVLN